MTTKMVSVYGPRRVVRFRFGGLRWSLGVLILLTGCTPRVDISAEKPITINLNVKIEHEIRVKVDNDLDRVLSPNSGLF